MSRISHGLGAVRDREQTYVTEQAAVAQNEGRVKFDEGNLEAAKVNLDYTRITAPFQAKSACVA